MGAAGFLNQGLANVPFTGDESAVIKQNGSNMWGSHRSI